MGMYRKKGAALLVASVLLTGAVFPSVADDLDDQLADVQGQISAAQESAANAQAVINEVSAKLAQIKRELDAANAELSRIRGEQAKLNAQIRQTEAELQKAIDDLHARQAILAKRVRAIYMHGQLNYLDVIVGSHSFSDFANRLELLKRIIKADFSLILEIQEKQRAIEAKKAQLEQEKQQLDALEAEAAKTQQTIAAKHAEQQKVLDEAKRHKAAAEQMERELQAASADIQAQIQQRIREREAAAAAAAASGGGGDYTYVQGTGQFSWPVSGPITSPFGYRIHPIFGTQIYHAGIDIGVPEGTPVHAADSGTVIEADWIGGYGNAVIIDHGNGLQTVYGHNSSLAVSAGQSVSKGQVIAYAGQTGYATGPHVHFEVRVNGSPTDPMGYL